MILKCHVSFHGLLQSLVKLFSFEMQTDKGIELIKPLIKHSLALVAVPYLHHGSFYSHFGQINVFNFMGFFKKVGGVSSVLGGTRGQR